MANEHDEMGMVAFTAGHEAGEYEGEIVVAGSGEWIIRVHLTVEGTWSNSNFPSMWPALQAGKNILLGFFAINCCHFGDGGHLKA